MTGPKESLGNSIGNCRTLGLQRLRRGIRRVPSAINNTVLYLGREGRGEEEVWKELGKGKGGKGERWKRGKEEEGKEGGTREGKK